MRHGLLMLIVACLIPCKTEAQTPDSATVLRLQSRVNGQSAVPVAFARTGALVGGAIFGASGLALGLSTTRDCGEFFDIYCDTSAGEVVFATLVTGVFGAAVGGLIGLPISKMEDRVSGQRTA